MFYAILQEGSGGGIPHIVVQDSNGYEMNINPIFPTYREAAKVLAKYNFPDEYKIKEVVVKPA